MIGAVSLANLIAILWLPGLSWILMFNLHKNQSFLETFVLSFSISLSMLSLGLGLGSLLKVSLDRWIIPIFVIIFAGTLMARIRSFTPGHTIPRRSTVELGLLTLILVHAALLFIYLWEYPIFHNANTQDPLIHAQIVQNIVEAEGAGLLRETNYTLGLHFILALIVKNVPGELLITMRLFVIFLELVTVPLVYFVSARIFSKKTALIASFIYAFAIPLGVIHLTGPGTYANILGDFQSLTVVYFLHQALDKRQTADYLTLALAGGGLTLSHPSSMILLTYAWMFSIVILLSHRGMLTTYLKSICMMSTVPALGLIAFPRLLSRVIDLFARSLAFPTPLGLILAVYFQNVAFFIGLLGYLVMVSPFLIFCIRNRSDQEETLTFRKVTWISFLSGWFFYCSILSIQGNEIWRLVLCAIVPGSLLAAAGLSDVATLTWSRAETLTGKSSIKRVLRPAVVSSILLAILATSSAPFFFSEFYAPGKRERQIAVYESMCWIRDNTEKDDSFVSMKLPEYKYLPVVAHRRFTRDIATSFDQMQRLLPDLNVQYVSGPTDELKEKSLPADFSVAFSNEFVTVLKIHKRSEEIQHVRCQTPEKPRIEKTSLTKKRLVEVYVP